MIPSQERGQLSLSAAEARGLAAWVAGGGMLVVLSDSRGYGGALLNTLFGKKYGAAKLTNSSSTRTAIGKLVFPGAAQATLPSAERGSL